MDTQRHPTGYRPGSSASSHADFGRLLAHLEQRLVELDRLHREIAEDTQALALGLRQGETLGLMWDDIDFEKQQILSRRAHDDVEAGLTTADLDDDQVWVSPLDILAKRQVRLPAPVVETLLKVTAEVAQHAMSASAAAQVKSQSRTSNIAEDVAITEGRLPAAAPVPAPTTVPR